MGGGIRFCSVSPTVFGPFFCSNKFCLWETLISQKIGEPIRGLVPSLIVGLRVVQGLRVVPVVLYRYSVKISLKKARSPGTTEEGRLD